MTRTNHFTPILPMSTVAFVVGVSWNLPYYLLLRCLLYTPFSNLFSRLVSSLSLSGTLNNRFIAYDVTHADGLKLCESTAIGGCYAHTEKSNGYTCTVTYEGRNMGQDQAACACVENH